jgi:hypothetical protein
LLVVLGLHALLVLLWWSGLASVGRWLPPAAKQTPLLVRNVSIAPAVKAAPPVVDAVMPQTSSAPIARKDKKPVVRSAAPAAVTAAPPNPAITTPDTPVASTAEPAASQPPAQLDLALPRATGAAAMRGRGALSEAQGSTRQLALNDPRSNEHIDPTKKLPDAVAAAAKGDCMKGDFTGGGMGILSAPFLAAAALMDKCKPQR